MKHTFNRISHSLLLSSSIIAGGMASVTAGEVLKGQKIAMYEPASTMAAHFPSAKLSAERMLELADKLNNLKMTPSQKKLEFSLVYSAANKGLSEAQFRLANYYIDSELIAADEDKALYWLTQAIDQDHQGAKYVYENLYEYYIDIGC